MKKNLDTESHNNHSYFDISIKLGFVLSIFEIVLILYLLLNFIGDDLMLLHASIDIAKHNRSTWIR